MVYVYINSKKGNKQHTGTTINSRSPKGDLSLTGQVIIISLWILVILSVIALGIGHRVSMALRLSRYQKEGMRASYLAKAGLNWAIRELIINGNWVDNEEAFKKITVNKNQNEFATVSYKISEAGAEKTKYGILDEERKININTADYVVLKALLESCDIVAGNLDTLTDNIRAWRGDPNMPDEAKDYRDLGYECKQKNLVNIEELMLVKGITPEIYSKIKGLITIYGGGKVNINTVDSKVLEVLLNACMRKVNSQQTATALLGQILSYREIKTFNTADLTAILNIDSTSVEFLIIEELEKLIDVKSQNFRIISTGKIASINLERTIECVYDRGSKTIIYQHEN